MTNPRILVAGIGNIFLGDDGFGVELAQQLLRREWPAGVCVRDFGIRGFDLAYAIMDGYDTTLMLDALSRGDRPGTLYVLEADLNAPDGLDGAPLETHGMDPVQVLHLVKTLGGQAGRVLVVGCEPETFGPENEGQMGLSEPVQAAIAEAVQLVGALVEKVRQEEFSARQQA